MKEVVDEILAAEKNVEALLAEAREKAAHIRQESEKEAGVLVAAAQEAAQELLRSSLAAAKEAAQQSRDARFADFRNRQQQLRDRNRAKLDALVDGIVAMITTPRQPR